MILMAWASSSIWMVIAVIRGEGIRICATVLDMMLELMRMRVLSRS